MAYLDSAQAMQRPPMAMQPGPEGQAGPMLPGLGAPMQQGPMPIGGAPLPLPQPDLQSQRQISPEHKKLLDWANEEITPNIAEEIDETALTKISQQCQRGYERDLRSLSDYYAKNDAAFDLASQVLKEKNTPWPKASNVIFPLITQAAFSFAARAYPAIVSGRNVVKGITYGSDDGVPQMAPDGTPVIQGPAQPGMDGPVFNTPQGPMVGAWAVPPGAKKERADRIAEHMSYQVLELTTNWEEDTDKLLHLLPIAGCWFRKTYYSAAEGKNRSTLVGPKKLVIHYKAKSMERAPRISEEFELYPNEIEEKSRLGEYLKEAVKELGLPEDGDDDKDAPHHFIEQHCWYDLDDDGYKEPYIITLHKSTWKVVRIVARYDADGVKVSKKDPSMIVRIEPTQYYTKYDFLPNVEGGLYGMGFGQLLHPINAAINTTINMMLDAGHFQTAGGGFVGKGISMMSGSVRFKPGEYKVINSPGQDIRNAVVPLQLPGPSDVLFQLLGLLIKSGESIAATNDVLEGSSNMANMQPTTMIALIEQGLKVFTAIYKRVHRSLKNEFGLVYRLNRLHLEDRVEYQWGDDWRAVTREDYQKGAGVKPYSDPDMVSDMQKMGKAQLLNSMKDDPSLDRVEINKRIFEAAKIDRSEALFAKQQQPDPIVIATVQESEAKAKQAMSTVSLNALKEATERANQVKTYADAVLALAKADEIEGDMDMNWISSQLDVMRGRMEGINGSIAPRRPGGLQPPPGQEMLEAPEGPENEAEDQGEQPPVDGARKAPDGNWYVPDPERQGKYLQVMPG